MNKLLISIKLLLIIWGQIENRTRSIIRKKSKIVSFFLRQNFFQELLYFLYHCSYVRFSELSKRMFKNFDVLLSNKLSQNWPKIEC